MPRIPFRLSALTVPLILTAGTLSAQEMILLQDRAPDTNMSWTMLPALEGMDRDGDDLLSASEIGGTKVPEAFDLDGDGLLSVVELSQGYFGLADVNDDGFLSDEELQAMTGLPAAGVSAPAT